MAAHDAYVVDSLGDAHYSSTKPEILPSVSRITLALRFLGAGGIGACERSILRPSGVGLLMKLCKAAHD
jgi:hypothetical protein